jgi:hypothetical protein
VKDKASARKLRLFACAACRRIWHVIADERSRAAVEVSERYADGLADQAELMAAAARATLVADAAEEAKPFGWNAARTAALAATTVEVAAERAACAAADGDLVRCIFGNPFRPVSLDRSWLLGSGPPIASLAAAFSEGRAPDTIPVLADALEEAGCPSPEVLDHLRGPGRHARGCWVIDLILGKV